MKAAAALTQFVVGFSTFLPPGFWWLLNSQDVGCNREALSMFRCRGADNRLQAV